MGVFFNVTTFAAGTKPAQIYDLYQESQIKPGKSFGILTMEYVSHKLTIVLYAAVMLCFFHTVLFQVSGLEKNYLLTGSGCPWKRHPGSCFAAAIILKKKKSKKRQKPELHRWKIFPESGVW